MNLASKCIEWEWNKNKKGYGVIRINGKQLFAHRLAVALSGRNIPKSKVCDHLCRNHSCINPDHIELVSMWENSMRGESIPAQRKRSKTCLRGHLWDKKNTWFRKKGSKIIWRQCRKCRAVAEAKRKKRLKKLRGRYLQ